MPQPRGTCEGKEADAHWLSRKAITVEECDAMHITASICSSCTD